MGTGEGLLGVMLFPPSGVVARIGTIGLVRMPIPGMEGLPTAFAYPCSPAIGDIVQLDAHCASQKLLQIAVDKIPFRRA